MTDTNAGTEPTQGEAQTPAPAEQTGTPPAGDEVTTLRSRNAGLDAKVTELQKARQEAERKAADAAKKLADYEAELVSKDEALRAQVAAKDAELAAIKAQARQQFIESKYPETFGVLGEAALGLSDDQLAASEARMSGVSGEPPTPLGANPGRTQAPRAKALEDMTTDEVKQYMKTAFNPEDLFGPRG